jgi:hypothetical protein
LTYSTEAQEATPISSNETLGGASFNNLLLFGIQPYLLEVFVGLGGLSRTTIQALFDGYIDKIGEYRKVV